jgi:hypothetical protein
MVNLTDRLKALLGSGSLTARLRQVLLRATIAGLSLVPVTQGMPAQAARRPAEVALPLIIDREKRIKVAPLVFSSVGQETRSLFIQHRSHSSHSSHRSHSSHSSHVSGTTVRTPSPAPIYSPPPTPVVLASRPVMPATDVSPVPAGTEKLAVTIKGVSDPDRFFTGTDEFDTDYKLYYTSGTKIVKAGTTEPRSMLSIDIPSPPKLFLSGKHVIVYWEKVGTIRVAVQVTFLD